MATPDKATAAAAGSPLDPSFVQYCADNGIDLRELEAATRIPRYMYVTAAARRLADTDLLETLRRDLPPGKTASFVPWLPRGVAIEVSTSADESPDQRFSFAKWGPHVQGLVAGMDAASMAAVVALAPQRGDAVLDVCCAPGMKLGMIADAVADAPPQVSLEEQAAGDAEGEATDRGGVAVGIDIALHRLHVARSCLRRAQRGCRQAVLVLADGRTFDPAQVDLSAHRRMPTKQWDQRVHRRVNAGRDKDAAVGPATPPNPIVVFEFDGLRQRRTALPKLFDRVLVDAECTHDGSVAHVVHDHASSRRCSAAPAPAQPSAEVGNAASVPTQTSKDMDDVKPGLAPTAERGRRRLHAAGDELRKLQLALLRRGFELVRPGGTLVYSTCSFSRAQNEDLVIAFLDAINADTDVGKSASGPPVATVEDPAEEAEATHQLSKEEAALFRSRCRLTDLVSGSGVTYGPSARFTPMTSATSFQFMAKIRKNDHS